MVEGGSLINSEVVEASSVEMGVTVNREQLSGMVEMVGVASGVEISDEANSGKPLPSSHTVSKHGPLAKSVLKVDANMGADAAVQAGAAKQQVVKRTKLPSLYDEANSGKPLPSSHIVSKHGPLAKSVVNMDDKMEAVAALRVGAAEQPVAKIKKLLSLSDEANSGKPLPSSHSVMKHGPLAESAYADLKVDKAAAVQLGAATQPVLWSIDESLLSDEANSGRPLPASHSVKQYGPLAKSDAVFKDSVRAVVTPSKDVVIWDRLYLGKDNKWRAARLVSTKNNSEVELEFKCGIKTKLAARVIHFDKSKRDQLATEEDLKLVDAARLERNVAREWEQHPFELSVVQRGLRSQDASPPDLSGMREARDFSRSGLNLDNGAKAQHPVDAYRQQLLPLSQSEIEGHECLAETVVDTNAVENARAASACLAALAIPDVVSPSHSKMEEFVPPTKVAQSAAMVQESAGASDDVNSAESANAAVVAWQRFEQLMASTEVSSWNEQLSRLVLAGAELKKSTSSRSGIFQKLLEQWIWKVAQTSGFRAEDAVGDTMERLKGCLKVFADPGQYLSDSSHFEQASQWFSSRSQKFKHNVGQFRRECGSTAELAEWVVSFLEVRKAAADPLLLLSEEEVDRCFWKALDKVTTQLQRLSNKLDATRLGLYRAVGELLLASVQCNWLSSLQQQPAVGVDPPAKRRNGGGPNGAVRQHAMTADTPLCALNVAASERRNMLFDSLESELDCFTLWKPKTMWNTEAQRRVKLAMAIKWGCPVEELQDDMVATYLSDKRERSAWLREFVSSRKEAGGDQQLEAWVKLRKVFWKKAADARNEEAAQRSQWQQAAKQAGSQIAFGNAMRRLQAGVIEGQSAQTSIDAVWTAVQGWTSSMNRSATQVLVETCCKLEERLPFVFMAGTTASFKKAKRRYIRGAWQQRKRGASVLLGNWAHVWSAGAAKDEVLHLVLSQHLARRAWYADSLLPTTEVEAHEVFLKELEKCMSAIQQGDATKCWHQVGDVLYSALLCKHFAELQQWRADGPESWKQQSNTVLGKRSTERKAGKSLELAQEQWERVQKEQPRLASVVVQHSVSGQQLVFERCEAGESNELAADAARSLGIIDAKAGEVVVLSAKTADKNAEWQKVVFTVVEKAAPSIVWAARAQWAFLPPRLPGGKELGDFDANLEWLQPADDGSCEHWWDLEQQRCAKQADEEGANKHALVPDKWVTAPHTVCGPWLLGEPVLSPGDEYRYPHMPEDNEDWMAQRPSVFIPSGMTADGMEEKWRQFGADEQVLQWIREGGYKVKVGEAGEGHFMKNGKLARANSAATAELVVELLLKRSWEVVEEDQLRNIIPINLAPKPSKIPPWRLISDARCVNEHIADWKFKYECLRSVPMVVNPNDWMLTVDLEDAYYSAGLHAESRSLFGHKLVLSVEALQKLKAAGVLPEGWDAESQREVCIQPKGLPMGFKNSCAVWTHIGKVLTAKWRRQGIRCLGYIDDFLFAAATKEEAVKIRDVVLNDLVHLGLAPNFKKSMAVPAQRVKFLGFLVDSKLMRYFVPGERLDKMEAAAEKVATTQDMASFRELASIAGKVISMAAAVPAVRLLTQECYNIIRPTAAEGWDHEVPVTDEVKQELLLVASSVREWNKRGAPIRRQLGATSLRVITDASAEGFGYRIDGRSRQWQFGEDAVAAARAWQEAGEELEHQVWRELRAVEECIKEREELMSGGTILLLTDASAVVRYINAGAGPSKLMTAMMKRIFHRCVARQISLVAEHVPGVLMKEAAVDSLSRWGEFQVAAKVFRNFNTSSKFGKAKGAQGFTCDLYASEKSKRCSRYGARGAMAEKDGGATGCVGDARCPSLRAEENLWLCPPLAVIQQALMSFMEMDYMGTIVVPDWENQPWSVFLRERAEHSVALPWQKGQVTMQDVADKKGPHYADKWRFRAYFVDNRGGRARKLHGGEQASKVAPTTWIPRRLNVADQSKQVNGVRLGAIQQRRCLRVLDIFSGLGATPMVLQRLAVDAKVWEIELDPVAREVASLRNPGAEQLSPHDVWYWCSAEGLQRLKAMQLDLVVAGFPCQSVSRANSRGAGLRGKSGVFMALRTIVQELQKNDIHLNFLVECTDFSGKHAADFEFVSASLGVEPVVLCAGEISACYRKRAYWASFPVPPLEQVEVDPNVVLDPGRVTWWKRLPTIVASGQSSWNTREVVEDEWGRVGPLNIAEMERAMEFDVDYTEAEGVLERDRFRLIGNAFHAGVLKALLLAFVSSITMRAKVITRNDPRGQGMPFEENEDGPSAVSRIGRANWGALAMLDTVPPRSTNSEELAGSADWSVLHDFVMQSSQPPQHKSDSGKQQGTANWGLLEAAGQEGKCTESAAHARAATTCAIAGAREHCDIATQETVSKKEKQPAAWKLLLQGQHASALPAARVSLGAVLSTRWNSKLNRQAPELSMLSWKRQRPEKRKQLLQSKASIQTVGSRLADDYAVKSKAEATWQSYASWWGVFVAFCELFEVTLVLDEAHATDWRQLVEALRVAAALMSLEYSLSTIEIFVSAVSCYFKLAGWRTPWESEVFKATLEGIRRELGCAKNKSPPVEAVHVAELFKMPVAPGWSELQWLQGKLLLIMGWQLFNRRQDFGRLQPCDLRFFTEGPERFMQVLIRYAKNDVRGKTRAPVLAAQHAKGQPCPVLTAEQYLQEAEIWRHPQCNKVWGEPWECDHCPPLFPSILAKAKGGKRPRAMPDSRVNKIVKGLMLALAKETSGLLTVEAAKRFTAKSLRSGGTSAASGETVRDAVLQGHGGWLNRTSLVHYDVMVDSEKSLVSKSLNAALAANKLGQRARTARKQGQQQRKADAPLVSQRKPSGRLRTLEPAESEDELAVSDEEQEYEQQFKIQALVGMRNNRSGKMFRVRWMPCKENRYARDEETWESEQRLLADGQQARIAQFLAER